MAQLVKMKIGNSGTILIEVSEEDIGFEKTSRGTDVIKEVDEAFDAVIQHEIVENCRVLLGAFDQLKRQALPPAKATAEFGLKFTAEGNVYVVKTTAEASFKVSIEWQFK
jgi:hypothetical protein